MFQKVNFLIIVLLIFNSCQNDAGQSVENKHKQPRNEVYQLVWSDEFDQTDGIDTTKWTFEYGDGCPDLCGWGNNELQFYTNNRPENARLENGNLVIEAKMEKMESRNFSSAKLVSKNKGDWKYCKMDIRAKLPSGLGTWPAIWMLPTDWKYGGWPESGEIDIMEHVGYEPDSIYGSAHTKSYHHSIGTQKTKGVAIADCEAEFHVYSIVWEEDKIIWSVDEQPYFEFKNEEKTHKEWPFDQPFYLILNLAVGGNWGGQKGLDESIFPQKMLVDYVRVYQKKS